MANKKSQAGTNVQKVRQQNRSIRKPATASKSAV